MHRIMLNCYIIILLLLLLNDRVDCKYNVNKLLKEAQNKSLKFSWQNCGPPNDILKLSSLNVSPDPVPLPGVLTIDIDANLQNNIKGPLAVKL